MKLKVLAIAALMTVFSFLGAASVSTGAFAAQKCPSGSLRAGTEIKAGTDTASLADCNIPKSATTVSLMDKVSTIINVVVSIVGIIAVGVVVLGGIGYATSQGDAAKAAKAKNTILYGIVGLVIALLAFAIVNFVLRSVF